MELGVHGGLRVFNAQLRCLLYCMYFTNMKNYSAKGVIEIQEGKNSCIQTMSRFFRFEEWVIRIQSKYLVQKQCGRLLLYNDRRNQQVFNLTSICKNSGTKCR